MVIVSSIRKHVSQMTEVEVGFLKSELEKIPNWRTSLYTEKRLRERGGHERIPMETISCGEIIEFHRKDNDNRVLIRGTKRYHKDVPCIVYSINTGDVVTVYWNRWNDDHRTINMSRYDEALDVFGYFPNANAFQQKLTNYQHLYERASVKESLLQKMATVVNNKRL